MRLNQASDFALRILMLLATKKEPVTVEMISRELNLVKSHVMKIVAKLVKAGVLTAHRGRSGGVGLGKPVDEIIIGDVVREIEADFAIVECMQDKTSNCTFSPQCKLRGVMADARTAFLAVLDAHTLKSITLQLK
ncbi:MAG: Rrf2 family transcriptional regulator [Hyphomicrobiales bacterium]